MLTVEEIVQMLRDTGGDRTVRVTIGTTSTHGHRETLNAELAEKSGIPGVNGTTETVVVATASLPDVANGATIVVAAEDGSNPETWAIRGHQKERNMLTRIMLTVRRL